MSASDWDEMDELARSTIMLTLSKSVYFNVKEMKTSYELWQKLCDMYGQKSAASQVYWLKQLVDLKMKDETPMSSHLNEFNTIFSQLSAQEVEFADSVKTLFLLITLPESWDTFRTAISNSTPASGLTSASEESSLLTEEVNKKNMDSTHGGNGLYVRGRSKERSKSDDKGKGCSKSCGCSNIECYHCHKKGHMKKDCHLWKKEKGNDKKQDNKQDKNKGRASSSGVKIEEINAVSEESKDGEILLILSLDSTQLVAKMTSSCMTRFWIQGHCFMLLQIWSGL